MKQIICAVIVLVIGSSAIAQSYKTAIGLKGGYPGYGSISAKHYLSSANAIEGNVGTGSNGLWIQGLYEWNHDLPTSGLNWYIGVGPNVGFQSSKLNNGSSFYLSGSALLGIEYTFNNLPLNLALDTGPIVQVLPNIGFGWGGGLAIRYAIK